MSNESRSRRSFVADVGRLAAVAPLAGCAHAPEKSAPAPAPQAAASSGPAPDDNLNAVAWTQTAIEHDLVYREVSNGVFEQTAVTTGNRVGDMIGIVSGLEPGQRVVTDGVMLLKSL